MPAETLRKNRATVPRSMACLETNPSAQVQVETTKKERSALDKALLSCGFVAPLVYLATDVIAGLRWEGYSFRDQTISELNAIGAPTRSLTIVLGLVGYSLFVAFGVGVWRSASAATSSLRLAGAALVAFGVLALYAVPFFSMHVREAEETFSDTLHLLGGGFAGLLLLVIIGFGAAAFGKRFRLYSIATIVATFVFAAWSGMEGPELADNLATPWIGVKERVGIYTYQLWLIVFAIALLRRQRKEAAEAACRKAIWSVPALPTIGAFRR
jgi:hypothetical protein